MDSRDGMQLKDGRGGERRRPAGCAAQLRTPRPGWLAAAAGIRKRGWVRLKRRRRSEQFQFPMF